MLEENGVPIGQLELQIRSYEGQEIGYVNLYYLVPEKRGKGLGKHLHSYVVQFFKEEHSINEYHLRVSPSNTKAIEFYQRNGMVKLTPEFDGKVIRMRGKL